MASCRSCMSRSMAVFARASPCSPTTRNGRPISLDRTPTRRPAFPGRLADARIEYMMDLVAEKTRRAAAREGDATRPLRPLLGLNFFMADVQAGIGPFLGVFLLA